MKKNLFLRLCLMMALFLGAISCRQEYLQDHSEGYNSSSKFQLTSKRISLSQSLHKESLTKELKSVKQEIRKALQKTTGRTINLGDSISIDTDEVIYMQNGPSYYTYTFSIKRNNTIANAPVENLVLTPLPDGTFKGFLVSYNLTEQEKQIINNGGTVQNLKSKTTIVDLKNITFGNPNTQRQDCYWKPEIYYTTCNGQEHHHNGELGSPAGPCTAEIKSLPYVGFQYICESLDDENTDGGYGEGTTPPLDQGGPGEDDTNTPINSNECPDNGIMTQPQDPTNDIDDLSCNNGVPTQPNLSTPKNPCEKLKTLIQKPNIVDIIDLLNQTSNFSLNHERTFLEKNGVFTEKPSSDCQDFFYKDPTTDICITTVAHTHQNFRCDENGVANIPVQSVPSAGDIVNVLLDAGYLKDYCNKETIDYNHITISQNGTYIVNYNGSSTVDLSNAGDWETLYDKGIKDLIALDKFSLANQEAFLMKFIHDNMPNISGLGIYKKEGNIIKKLEYDPATNTVTKTPCP